MTTNHWVCSALPQDCRGPFRSIRQPGDRTRERDVGHCLIHDVVAWRMVTRIQRRWLGWSHREGVEYVELLGASARSQADQLIEDESTPRRRDGDGPVDEPDPDGPVDEPDPDGIAEAWASPETAMTDSRLRQSWSKSRWLSEMNHVMDEYMRDEDA